MSTVQASTENRAAARPRVNTAAPFPALPRPSRPAHVIRDDAQAIEVARRLAAEFAVEASLRDQEGYLPIAEIDAYSQSGLWGITVPRAYGGAGVSYATLAEVIRILAEADSSIAQITQNHLALVAHIDLDASEEQKRDLFGLVLQGIRFGNAFSEKGSKNVASFETKLRRDGDSVVVSGQKFYTTGALLAHIVPIVAVDDEGKGYLAFADRDSPGLTVINDWSAFGQRTTASGSIRIENVRVPASRLVPVAAFDRPTAAGAISQIIQSAIDAGIAAAAIAETVAFVRTRSRPWIDSGKESAGEDPFTVSAVGELVIRLHAAEALLERAGKAIDVALATPSEEAVTQATLVTSESKVLTTEVAIAATNKLFELAGTRSTLSEHNLDRHWRNARTHTLHDPVRWKYFHIGNFHLNGVNPPRHPWN
ncbi:acyL-CoA dehydrogenase, type 2 domain [Thauera sp. 27]|uniref:SfnB family sulfur acquisition oxidoreductase n=1 Tax=Thauera sp. 27 TaxID=305700 RepID=UPI0002D0BE15|nr:SfnB family sulfur acquisition oxidoreductase [Thauera sp. 27]ENO78725.1 acyL-CoA dehydrogenase, type 2 domain [Thauera sp. 27]